jgi:hypothetical protein
MCKVLKVHPSGYYTWQAEPASSRATEDEYLLGFIKQFWLESGSVYGYRKIHKDLISIGEQCGKNRAHRLMKSAGIQSERGYKRKAHYPSLSIQLCNSTKSKRGHRYALITKHHLEHQQCRLPMMNHLQLA